MSAAAQFTVQHVAVTPRGWHVRTKLEGKHRLRIAFPPGPRQTGVGKLVEILHPRGENPCPQKKRYANPGEELLIFGNPSRRRKKNDGELDDAELLYQEFHGRDPKEILKVQRSDASRKTYVACGPLLSIGAYAPGVALPTPAHWDEYQGLCLDFRDGVTENYDLNKKGVMLAANTEGTQLYAIGGDQDLDGVLDDFDVDASKDLVALCEAAFIVYFDEKPHTRFQGVEYMHKFDQPRPVIGYDRLKKEIFFVGGRYELKGNWLEH